MAKQKPVDSEAGKVHGRGGKRAGSGRKPKLDDKKVQAAYTMAANLTPELVQTMTLLAKGVLVTTRVEGAEQVTTINGEPVYRTRPDRQAAQWLLEKGSQYCEKAEATGPKAPMSEDERIARLTQVLEAVNARLPRAEASEESALDAGLEQPSS